MIPKPVQSLYVPKNPSLILMRYNLKLFFFILVPYAITQLIGITVAYRLLPLLHIFGIQQGTALQHISFAHVAIWFGTALLFFWIMFSLPRIGQWVYRIFLILLLFSGLQTAIFAISPVSSTIVAIILLIIFWSIRSILIHNTIMILSLAGIATTLGLSLTPPHVVVILTIFSIYDIVAVYITGHMIKLANAMIQAKAIFGFIIPESLRSLHTHTATVQPGHGFMILGSGDILLPLLLPVALVSYSLWSSIIVASFSLIGLFLMHMIFQNQKRRRPMAALPPIALMTIIGYLVALYV